MAYYMYLGYDDEPVLMPVTPEKLTLKINNQNETVTLIDEGQVSLLKTPGLTEVTINELLLPMQSYPFALYDEGFQTADYFLEKIEAWKLDTKKPLKFILSRTDPAGEPLFDTNISVSVEDYEIVEDAGDYGMDVAVKDLTLLEYREWGPKKLEGVVISRAAAVKKRKAAIKAGKKVSDVLVKYEVKEGDTLKSIAKALLYDSSRWEDIYKMNKTKIEKAAKSNGRKSSNKGLHIYAGIKLTLPKLV